MNEDDEYTDSCCSMRLSRRQHIKYLKRNLGVLPQLYSSYDSSIATIAFFSLCSLDLLGQEFSSKDECIEWLYSLLIISNDNQQKGFTGSNTIHPHTGHLAMTYAAIASLLILGDDLSRINRRSLCSWVKSLQMSDGCFRSTLEGGEADMRFLYTAVAICYMLDDWSGLDIPSAINFIKLSIRYDGGIGQGPYLESHGGSTFCALASLYLIGRLDEFFSMKQRIGLVYWCCSRLSNDGFQGRPNKPVDTCYAFWIGASLRLLEPSISMSFQTLCRSAVLNTQDPIVGGFSKWAHNAPDPLHTCLGLASLSLDESREELCAIYPSLIITQRCYQKLVALNKR